MSIDLIKSDGIWHSPTLYFPLQTREVPVVKTYKMEQKQIKKQYNMNTFLLGKVLHFLANK